MLNEGERLRQQVVRLTGQRDYWKRMAKPMVQRRCVYCGKLTMIRSGTPAACYLHADLPALDGEGEAVA